MSVTSWLNNRKNWQRGDTIIEVMLSIAIVGMVIGLSYSTANRAIKTGRAAQEQVEAMRQAQTQIERLKYVAGNNWASVSASPFAKFCIDPNLALVNANLAAPTACRAQGTGGLYDIGITYVNTALSPDTFTATTSWMGINGQQVNVNIVYRLHQP